MKRQRQWCETDKKLTNEIVGKTTEEPAEKTEEKMAEETPDKMTEKNEQSTKDKNSAKHSFQEIAARLQDIAQEVERDDASLEASLDLLEEAVKLGGEATNLVDQAHFSDEEKEAFEKILNEETAEEIAEETVADSSVAEDGAE